MISAALDTDRWPRVSLAWLFGLLASLTIGYFLATGFFVGAAAVFGLIVGVMLGIAQPMFLIMAWVIGVNTVFPFGNAALSAVPLINADRALFLLLAGLLTLRAMVATESMKPLTRVEKAMFIYLAIVLVSWATTLPDKGQDAMRKDLALIMDGFFMPVFAYLLARNMNWTPRLLKVVLWAMVLLIGGYAIFSGLLQDLFGWRFYYAETAADVTHPDRITGPFVNALMYGMVLALMLLFAFMLFLHSRDPMVRVSLVFIALGLLVFIVLSKGRAVWLSVPISLMMVFFLNRRSRPLLVTMVIIGVLTGPLLVPLLTDVDVLIQRLTQASPVYNRFAAVPTAINMWSDYPIFGIGFGYNSYNLLKPEYYASFAGVSAQFASFPSVPHNEVVHVLVLMGVVGLAAYLWMLWTVWSMLGRVRRAWKQENALISDFALFTQAGFLVLLLNAMFMDLMLIPQVLILYFFVAGMVGHWSEGPPPPEPAAAAEPEILLPGQEPPGLRHLR
jgi:O-antigen ligase